MYMCHHLKKFSKSSLLVIANIIYKIIELNSHHEHDLYEHFIRCLLVVFVENIRSGTVNVLQVKSDSDVMFCLQSYQELIIDRSLVY